MNIRAPSLALVVLLGSVLTGCLTGRRVGIAAGEYAAVHGSSASTPGTTVEAVQVDRDNQTAWFVLTDGSQLIAAFTPLPRREWPAGCPGNLFSTRMEVLRIEEEALTIGSTTFNQPVLVRDCPRDPMEIVLRNAGEIGGSGNACSKSADCLVFEPVTGVESLLPRSMKGYELYSWYAEEADAWYYTLVTGTNRVKSYEEISSSESVVTEEDWVKITVRGTDSLRSLLNLLPKGEEVYWLGSGRLEGDGVDVVLPQEEHVREIERHCERRGLQLFAAR